MTRGCVHVYTDIHGIHSPPPTIQHEQQQQTKASDAATGIPSQSLCHQIIIWKLSCKAFGIGTA